MSRRNGWRGGAQRALAMRRSVQRWCRSLQSLLELLRIFSVRRAGCGEHSVESASAATPACSKPGEATCRPYARLIPGLCWQGLEWHASSQIAGGMSRSHRLEWVSVGQKGGLMHGVVRSWDGGGTLPTLATSHSPCQLKTWWELPIYNGSIQNEHGLRWWQAPRFTLRRVLASLRRSIAEQKYTPLPGCRI